MKNFALRSTLANRDGPIEELTKTKLKMPCLSGFPEASEGTFSIPCEDQRGNRILQVLRIADLFAVLFSVEEGCAYLPLN